MTDWMKAVMEARAKLKKKNPKATLADAMKEAKKTYKKKQMIPHIIFAVVMVWFLYGRHI